MHVTRTPARTKQPPLHRIPPEVIALIALTLERHERWERIVQGAKS